jgi:hypothetical protein
VTTSPRDRVGTALVQLADGLSSFVSNRMSANAQHGEWLADYVASARPPITRPSMTDPAFLLRVMWDNWNTAFRTVLGRRERSFVSELRDDRNIWAHNEPITPEDAYRTLDSVQRLLAAIGSTAADDVGRSKTALVHEHLSQGGHRDPGAARWPSSPTEPAVEEPPPSEAVPAGMPGRTATRDDIEGRRPASRAPSTAKRVERAVRSAVHSGQVLETPSRGRPFEVARVDGDGVVLLLGKQRAWTRLSWPILEGALEYLEGRGWVDIGGVFDVGSQAGTLDAYLNQHVKRATAGWVAALFAVAGLVEIDRHRPARVCLVSGE